MTENFKGRLADVIRRPLITEKATRGIELNQYSFEVDHRAAKPEIKAAVQPYYKRAYDEVQKPRHDAQKPKTPGKALDQHIRNEAAIEYLTNHFHEAPVWIVACAKGVNSASSLAGASVYPAVQNMLLAARALGLGATLTARHIAFRNEVDTLLGLPGNVSSFAILPIGYPIGKFGPTRRAPLSEVVRINKWDNPWPGS